MEIRQKSASFELARLIAVGVAIMAVSFLVIGKTRAAFTGQTVNPTNTLSTGTLTLVDDDANGALFNLTDMDPGTYSNCILVTYTGSRDPDTVHLYFTDGSLATVVPNDTTTLAPYLELKIEENDWASAPGFDDCTGYDGNGNRTTVYDTGPSPVVALASDDFQDTLTGFDDYADGLTGWDPNTTTATQRWYRFTFTLANDNDAQGKAIGFQVNWEVRTP